MKLIFPTILKRIRKALLTIKGNKYCKEIFIVPCFYFFELIVIFFFFTFNYLYASQQEEFFAAVLNGDLPRVEIAIKRGANINKGIEKKIKKIKHKKGEYFEGSTGLHIASGEGHLEIVSFLILRKVEINAKNKIGLTAFMTALYHKEEVIAKFLLDNGAKLIDRTDHSTYEADKHYTTLMAASAGGCFKMVKLLIKRNADVNALGHYAYTALWYALDQRHLNIAKFLIKKKANIDAELTCDCFLDSATPLQIYAESGDLEIVKFLVENKADINKITKYSSQTAFLTALYNEKKETAEFLLEKGAEFKNVGNNNYFPLIHASRNGYFKIVKMLIQRNADVNAADNVGYTALRHAIEQRHFKIVKYLIKKNADINLKDRNGNTALHHVTLKNQTELVKLLLSKNANTSIKNKEGKTAINIALESGNKELVDLFSKTLEY